MTPEKKIEEYLRKKVREVLKGIAYKFTSPGRNAVTDRLCVVSGYTFFVECKAPDKYLTEAQEREAKMLKDLDQWVYWVNSKSMIDKIIDFWLKKLQEEDRL